MKPSRSLVTVVLGSLFLLVPASALADDAHHYTPRQDINITYDGELNRAHGIRSGKGTMKDPYVISGWMIGNISIRDTTKAITIKHNQITGTLTLDWIGQHIHVHHNEIGDLRVNQNNARWGDNTGGEIMHNKFGSVGQLRHFDGTFAHNTVGAPESGTFSPAYPEGRAVNFDGFNGSRFVYNTIYGHMDARLHGHHHSSKYGVPSHVHADSPNSHMKVNHARRFHEVTIASNKIYSSHTYALAYLDTDHAGNDRTANSETNPWLNAPHQHWTRAHVVANRLTGAGLLVDVFNARDEKHQRTNTGLMEIRANRVILEQDPSRPFRTINGMEIRRARDLALKMTSNVIEGPTPTVDLDPLNAFQAEGTGILLLDLDKAKVSITSTRITNRQFGVRALQFTKSVYWTITGLTTDSVVQPVSYDNSVHNPPNN